MVVYKNIYHENLNNFFDKKFFYLNIKKLFLESNDLYKELLINSLTSEQYKELSYALNIGERKLSYSRFDLDSSFFITDNSNIHVPLDLQKRTTNTFFDITDSTACRLLNLSRAFNSTYLFWSGGIDSSVILTAILKNWKDSDLEKLKIVLDSNSIKENRHLFKIITDKKIDIINTNIFYDKKLYLTNQNLYVTGDHGDTLISPGGYILKFDTEFPNTLSMPWDKNIDNILKFFNNNQYSIQKISKSFKEKKISIETTYEFLWWILFEWQWHNNSYFILWTFGELDRTCDTKTFLENNCFRWFAEPDYQYWSLSNLNGSNLRYQGNIKTDKWIYKKYIFEFDKNIDYFNNKIKEVSATRNPKFQKNKQLIAIDTDYQIFYK